MIKNNVTFVEQTSESGERDVLNLINEFMNLLESEKITDVRKTFFAWVKEKGLSKKIANEVGAAIEELLSDDLEDEEEEE